MVKNQRKEPIIEKRKRSAPAEKSSQYKPRNVVVVNLPQYRKKKARDPRFDELAGEFNEGEYRSKYAFLDEMKDNEINQMYDAIKKEKNEAKKRILQSELTRMQQQRSSVRRRDRERRIRREVIQEELGKVQSGEKKPFYMKRGELKKLVREEEMNELRKKGKLGRVMNMKTKRNAEREVRRLPFRIRRDKKE
ncbi:hypothetical protein PCE1_001464 [Barthelona sp. PCE]